MPWWDSVRGLFIWNETTGGGEFLFVLNSPTAGASLSYEKPVILRACDYPQILNHGGTAFTAKEGTMKTLEKQSFKQRIYYEGREEREDKAG